MSSTTINLYRSAASYTITKRSRFAKTSADTYAQDPAGAFVITGSRKHFRDSNGVDYIVNEGAALVPVEYVGLIKAVRQYKRTTDKRASVFAVPISALTAEKEKNKKK